MDYKKSDDFSSVPDVLQCIVERAGIEILAAESLIGYFLDMAPQMQREARLIKIGVKTGAYSALVKQIDSSVDEQNRQIEVQKKRLMDDAFIEEKWAKTMLEWVAAVLYGSIQKQTIPAIYSEKIDTPKTESCSWYKEAHEALLKSLLGLAPQENIPECLQHIEDNIGNLSDEELGSYAHTVEGFRDEEKIQESYRVLLSDFAYRHWKRLAFDGYVQAQYYFSRHLEGKLLYDEALIWLYKAAIDGYIDAQKKLGDLYSSADLEYTRKFRIKANIAKAEKWYQQAAEQGDKYSELRLGYLFDRFRNAYKKGRHDDRLEFGTYEYIWGDMVDFGWLSHTILVPDDKKAECYYKAVAQKGFQQPLESFLGTQGRRGTR